MKKQIQIPKAKAAIIKPVEEKKEIKVEQPQQEKIYKLKVKISTNRPAGTILSKEVAEALIAVNPNNINLFE